MIQYRTDNERIPLKANEDGEDSEAPPLPDGLVIIGRGIAQMDRYANRYSFETYIYIYIHI